MVDGELIFNTKIDESGFEKGTKAIGNGLGNLKGQLKSLAKVAAAAFSVKMINDFAKSSKEAYNVQIEQETKLATIMKQRMGATNDVIDSVKQLASEQQKLGVIGDEVQLAGAQQVATFLTETDSIKTLLPAMNDLLAQQNGLNASSGDAVNIANLMGKVLQGQTSALKRVGISFSDAEEQVLKYGTESERAAMLAQVITNNVGHMNQALAQTDAGKQKQLANTMGDIKEQFGQAVMQIESVFLPVIQLLANGLSKVAGFAQAAGNAIRDAFGVESENNSASIATDTANAAASAAESYEEIAESAQDTQKAQENSLASFDKVIKIGKKEDSSSGSSAAGGRSGSVVNPAAAKQDSSKLVRYVKSGLTELIDWTEHNFGETLSKIWDGFKYNARDSWDIIKTVFSDTKELAGPLKKVINEDLIPLVNNELDLLGQMANDTWEIFNQSFSDIWSLAVYPCLKNFIEIGLPILIQFRDAVINIQRKIWNTIVPLLKKLWIDVARPVLKGIAALWTDLWEIIRRLWNKYGKPIYDAIIKAIDWVGKILNNLWDKCLKPMWNWLCVVIEDLWKEHLAPLLESVGEFVGEVVQLVMNLWNNVLAPIVNWLVETLGPVVSKVVDGIVAVVGAAIGFIVDTVKDVVDFFKGIVKFFSGVFSFDMGKAWDGIKDIFSAAWSAIKRIFEPVAEFFGMVWDWIKAPFVYAATWFKGIFADAWRFIKDCFSAVGEFFSSVWDWIKAPFVKVADWFKDKFEKAVEAVKKIFKAFKEWLEGLWDGIFGTVQIDPKELKSEYEKKTGKKYSDEEWEAFLKANKFAKGGVIDRATMAIVGEDGAEVVMPLEKNTGWIDKLAQRIAYKQRPIPQLATGTVVPANFGRFAAILGDNKREPEVVSPLSTMKQAVLEALAMHSQENQKQPVTINISLDTRNGKRLLTKQIIDDINDIIDSTGKVPINI